MQLNMSLDEYIEKILYILDIAPPNFIFDDDKMEGTELGRLEICIEDKYVDLFLKENYQHPFDVYYVVGHELRHLWQAYKNSGFGDHYINHKDTVELTIEEYNQQFAEIDANAFSLLMVQIYLGMTINPNMFPNPEEIFKRKEEIEKELLQ